MVIILIFWRTLNPEILVESAPPGSQRASGNRGVAWTLLLTIASEIPVHPSASLLHHQGAAQKVPSDSKILGS